MSYAIRVASLDHVPTRSSSIIVGEKQDSMSCCENFPCCYALNHGLIYIIAALIWGLGAIGCFAKAHDLLHLADDRGATKTELIVTHVVPLVGGIIIGHYWFANLAEKNIVRMQSLEKPKWHSSFRWQLWLFLIFFDGSLMLLSDVITRSGQDANQEYVSSLVFAGLDLSIFAALFVSFWRYPWRWSTFRVDNLTEATGDSKGADGTSNGLYANLLDPAQQLTDAMNNGKATEA